MLDNSVHPAPSMTASIQKTEKAAAVNRENGQSSVELTKTVQSSSSGVNGSQSKVSSTETDPRLNILKRTAEASNESSDCSCLRQEDDLDLQDLGCMNIKSLFKLFNSKKFKNWKLEQLFQLYFFKLNQSNLSIMMALMLVICTFQLIYHFVCGSSGAAKAVFISVFIVVLIVHQILCNHSAFSQRLMTTVCWSTCIVACAMVLTMTLDVVPRSASTGVSNTVFLIFILYVLLPVRMRQAVLFGIILASTHMISSVAVNYIDEFSWKQVCPKIRPHFYFV